jgi:molybdopterin-dependent oxidoreductase alpha subunit
MAEYKVSSGGGWPAIKYALEMARKSGGIRKLYRALKSKNTCKTCALGMGGQNGGMRDETGSGFQVCKKSMQAQAQDMQPPISVDFFAKHPLENLKKLSGRELEALGRLVHPIYLSEGASRFEVLGWQQAFEILLEHWRQANPERSFFYASGRSSMEAAFLLQILARQWGTNNVNNCSYYCHQGSGVGLTQSLGSGTATVTLEDVKKADLVVLIGANPASNHPRFMTHLVELRRRGGKVVVVNPFKELGLQRFSVPSDVRSLLFGSEIANFYLQPHCGGDLAFLKAAAVYLWREQKVDLWLLENHCNDFEAFKANLESEDTNDLLAKAGIAFEDLKRFCGYLTASKNTIFCWAMGVTHHLHGAQTVRMIANLALMQGMLGKPGAGLLPLRGHSNVQGVGTVGVVPKLKPKMVEALARSLQIDVPDAPGLDTFYCMQAAHRGEIDFAVLLGGNLYGSNPDAGWAAEALGRIKFTAFLNTTLNLGHLHAHGKTALILPVRARDEEKQATSQESMFNFVRLSLGGETAPTDSLPSETAVFAQIGKELFGSSPVPWERLHRHSEIRKFISETVPNMQPIAKIENGKDFTIPGRIYHQPKFNTENGKANLAILEAPDARPQINTFNLTTFRSEGQFNTIVYEDEDIYRGVMHRLVVFMNRADIVANNLNGGEWVWLQSETDKIQVQLVEAPIRQGNVAMYYPEANAIVPAKVDPHSKTPSFKRVNVKVTSVQV